MTSDFTNETYGKMPEGSSGADMISSLAACADTVLIQMAIAGRNDCFSLLMDRHLAAVKRRLRSMVPNEADLDDVVQEFLLKAWRHLATFRSECSLRTWMVRIAINEAFQLYRRGKYKRLCEPLDAKIALPEELADQRLFRAEATAAVRAAVAKLPRKYQEVVKLRDLCELGSEETAKRLSATVPAIKTRLFRARLMLSTELRKSGTPSLAAPGRQGHDTVRCCGYGPAA
jgi:RNA polymerase sigma-70 factor (ECF subfamily)